MNTQEEFNRVKLLLDSMVIQIVFELDVAADFIRHNTDEKIVWKKVLETDSFITKHNERIAEIWETMSPELRDIISPDEYATYTFPLIADGMLLSATVEAPLQ